MNSTGIGCTPLPTYYLGNREDAEDVTQEVLLRLWRRGMDLDADDVPRWITRVPRNACLDGLRRRVRRVDEVPETPADSTSNPHAELEAAELRDKLEGAIAELEETQRAVVVLRQIQGMRYEEIAAALEMPLNTVKVYLHRARQTLRWRLKEGE